MLTLTLTMNTFKHEVVTGDAVTPITPVTPAWQEDSTVAVTPSNDVAQIVSSCDSSLVGGDVGQNRSQLISKTIASTVQQCLDISNLSYTSTVDSSHLSHSTKVDSPSTNPTKSLQPSVNGRCNSVSSDVSNVRVYGANSKPISQKSQPSNTHKESCNGSDLPNHDINETFTFDKVIDGVYPLQSSPKSVLDDGTNFTQNSGTVAKERPKVDIPVVNSNTVIKTTVNSGTVTKSKAQIPSTAPKDMVKVIEPAGLKECNTSPNDRRTSVVRAFNFEGMPCPSPAGK